jgi:hypothetical protein
MNGIPLVRTRALIACVLLCVCIGICIFQALSTTSQILLLERAAQGIRASHAEAQSNDFRQSLLASLGLLAFLVCGIAFVVWLYFAYKILPSLGATRLEYSPAAAAVSFFIPFVNLIRPYQVVSEIWRASMPGAEGWSWTATATPNTIRAWWTLYLLYGFSGIAVNLTSKDRSIAGLISMSYTMLFKAVAEIAAAVLAIVVVQSTVARQETRHLEMMAQVRQEMIDDSIAP